MPMLGPTNDHEEIRRWAAIHGATPVEIALLKHDGEPTKIAFMFLTGTQKRAGDEAHLVGEFFRIVRSDGAVVCV